VTAPLLAVRGLGKSYGDKVALHRLDLEVAEGEMLGLLGPNGAGKTTAISMIAGVLTPSRGTATVAGHDVRSDPFPARRALGLVPQDLAVYEELTARQNLAFFAGLWGLRGAELRTRVDWALELAGLVDRAGERVSRYSGGMKRRLNLVAGLLHRPRLVIFDEPTVGVDPQSRNHIFETIRRLRGDGMTVIYTSHYMEEVQTLCERVAILDHGALIADDAIDALIRSHGGGSLEIEVDGEAAALVDRVAGLGEASAEGDRLRILPAGELAPIVAAVEGAGVTIRALRTLEPDLETVFLTLTGQRLRDQD